MLNVTGYDESINLLLREFNFTPKSETIPVLDALGRRCAQTIYAGEDMPPYTRSTMDGFAVHAADTFGSSTAIPAMLNITGAVEMGEYTKIPLYKGETVRIPTGGMLPEGADSVVMVEYTEEINENTVLVEKSVSPGENIIRKGEDIKAGDVLFKAGHVLRPQDIGALASLGIKTVETDIPFKVGVISTGNEIIGLNEELRPGKIRDINTYAIAAAIQKDLFFVRTYGIVKDDFESLYTVLKKAAEENEAVLLSGGSSVGVMDMTLKVISSMENAKLLIEGIALKPGKPTIAANVSGKPVFGLPGHPVSAFVLYHTVAAPLFYAMTGRNKEKKIKTAFFSENYATQPGRDEFVMVKLYEKNNQTIAEPVHAKSGMFLTITKADGIVRIRANKEGVYKGEEVTVQIF